MARTVHEMRHFRNRAMIEGMIGRIEGEVVVKREGGVIVSAGGVGYKLAITAQTASMLHPGEKAALWTHLAVRENALDLYGFADEESLRLFELLLMVSGIGPKSALAILDIAHPETLRSAIAEGNAGYLTKVSGIGKKTAEKIVLELREKVGVGEASHQRILSGDEEALEAMRALGYSLAEAREMLREVPPSFKTGTERLREALRIAGNA